MKRKMVGCLACVDAPQGTKQGAWFSTIRRMLEEQPLVDTQMGLTRQFAVEIDRDTFGTITESVVDGRWLYSSGDHHMTAESLKLIARMIDALRNAGSIKRGDCYVDVHNQFVSYYDDIQS